MLRDQGRLELTASGPTSFRVSDSRVPPDAPSHVVAFVEAHENDVEVVWLRGSIGAPGRFETLDQALGSIEASVADQPPAHSIR